MAKKDITRSPKFDPSIPRVSVEIEGEEYELSFDFRALAAAKSKLRALSPPVNIHILSALSFSDVDVDTLPVLFYAAAQRHQPSLSYEQASNLITMKTYLGIYAALAEAYLAAIGKTAEDAQNPPVAAETQV